MKLFKIVIIYKLLKSVQNQTSLFNFWGTNKDNNKDNKKDNKSDKKSNFLSLFYCLMVLFRIFFCNFTAKYINDKKMKPYDLQL